jgi:hypothetical protein
VNNAIKTITRMKKRQKDEYKFKKRQKDEYKRKETTPT